MDNLGEEVNQLVVPEPTIPENGMPLCGELDANGEGFDREQHTGTKRKDGTWRRKKVKVQEPVENEEDAKRRNFAAITVDTLTASLVAAFGDDWKPERGERDNLVAATDAVLADYAIDDLPPVVGLVFAASVYAVPRVDWDAVRAYFNEGK